MSFPRSLYCTATSNPDPSPVEPYWGGPAVVVVPCSCRSIGLALSVLVHGISKCFFVLLLVGAPSRAVVRRSSGDADAAAPSLVSFKRGCPVGETKFGKIPVLPAGRNLGGWEIFEIISETASRDRKLSYVDFFPFISPSDWCFQWNLTNADLTAIGVSNFAKGFA